MTDQPRTPAGSPDGGQFGSTGGAEAATSLTPPSPADPVVATVCGTLQGLGKLETQTAENYLEAAVHGTAQIVLTACPDATQVEWEWCGDGDSPDTLGDPYVTCSHTDAIGGGVVCGDDFASVHGMDELAFDGVGYGLSEGLMNRQCERLGVTAEPDGRYVLDLTADPKRFTQTVNKYASTHDQADAYLETHPKPAGRDAVHEWEDGFLDAVNLPDDERKDVIQFAVQNANKIDLDVMRDPEFLEAWARNEYLLDRLRSYAALH